MIEFKNEEEREAWLVADANRQIEWEKSLTYTDPETGEKKPTQQALHPRSFEEAYKIAERQLWIQQKPENPLKPKYVKLRGGTRFEERMNQDYSPHLEVSRSATETYIANCTVKSEGSILYTGSPKDISNELIDELLCTGDSSYNPSRPFRWYQAAKGGVDMICVMTTTEEEIQEGRMLSLNSYLEALDNPEIITIFKV